MASEDLIDWGPHLVTGIAQIDDQHKVLVDMCNEANVFMRGNMDVEHVKRLVRDLMSYALYHFEAEEELAEAGGYPQSHAVESAMHREQHRAFAEKVAALQQDLAVGKTVTREDLLGFLNAWLVNHILGTDMKLAEALGARPQASP